jgi:hypothetical protein
MLTACVAVYALELSGRWDRTLGDANDEAGIVAVVLCIGIAISVAGTVLKRRLKNSLRGVIVAPSLSSVRLSAFCLTLPFGISGPPLVPLRL